MESSPAKISTERSLPRGVHLLLKRAHVRGMLPCAFQTQDGSGGARAFQSCPCVPVCSETPPVSDAELNRTDRLRVQFPRRCRPARA